MTRDDIIRMARKSGAGIGSSGRWLVTQDELERFAALVATAEREECAKVCEAIEDEYQKREGLRYPELKTDAETGAADCAAAIRARSET